MKTAVTQTSINSYHTHPTKNGQTLKVAEFAADETKHGRLVWIGKIAEHFAIRGEKDLGQKSTASARLAEIKKHGAMLNGLKYRLELVRTERPQGGRCAVDMWALVVDRAKEAEQLALF